MWAWWRVKVPVLLLVLLVLLLVFGGAAAYFRVRVRAGVLREMVLLRLLLLVVVVLLLLLRIMRRRNLAAAHLLPLHWRSCAPLCQTSLACACSWLVLILSLPSRFCYSATTTNCATAILGLISHHMRPPALHALEMPF